MSTRTEHIRPSTRPAHSANDAFKRRFGFRLILAIAAAGLIHFLLIVYGPFGFVVDRPSLAYTPLNAIAVVTEPENPRLHEPIIRPAPPVRSTPPALPAAPDVATPAEIDVAPLGLFADDAPGIGEIPPPPEFAVNPLDGAFEFQEYVHVAPYMVAPELINRREVQRSLERNYPRALQDARVGGTLMVWFWIDENGEVQKYEIRETSGNRLLDEAAERVIEIMEFRPATHRGEKIPVIVALPITFQSR